MSFKTNAAVLLQPDGTFIIDEVMLDDIQENEVLVEIAACGICHTDVACRDLLGLPAVLGHEGTGTVRVIGERVTDIAVGDTVIISYPSCGRCPSCRAGKTYTCVDIVRLKFAARRNDGSYPVSYQGQAISSAFFQQSSFANHVITPARSVVKVSSKVPASVRASLGCAVQTGAGAVLNTFQAKPGSSLVVAGLGGVGLSAVMAAQLAGVTTIIGIDKIPQRLELALELGATSTINTAKQKDPTTLRKLLPGGADFFLDTTASKLVWTTGLEHLAMGGTFGFVEVPPASAAYVANFEHVLDRAAVMQGIIQGSSIPRVFIPRLIDWYQAGKFPVDKIIKPYPFSEINQAFADVAAHKVVKPVLMM